MDSIERGGLEKILDEGVEQFVTGIREGFGKREDLLVKEGPELTERAKLVLIAFLGGILIGERVFIAKEPGLTENDIAEIHEMVSRREGEIARELMK